MYEEELRRDIERLSLDGGIEEENDIQGSIIEETYLGVYFKINFYSQHSPISRLTLLKVWIFITHLYMVGQPVCLVRIMLIKSLQFQQIPFEGYPRVLCLFCIATFRLIFVSQVLFSLRDQNLKMYLYLWLCLWMYCVYWIRNDVVGNHSSLWLVQIREAAKKVLFLIAGPLRPYPPPSCLMAIGIFFYLRIWSSILIYHELI